MNFINDILEKSVHNALPYKLSQSAILFEKSGNKSKVGQFYSSPIAYYEAGGWRGYDPILRNQGGYFSGEGTPFRILPTGEVQWAGGYRHLVDSLGYYEIESDTYIKAVDLPATGSVVNHIHRKEIGIYRYDTVHNGLSMKGELTITEKPSNMSGDLFVISARVWGASLPLGKFNEDGFDYVEEGKSLRIFGGGTAMDANGVPVPVQMYVKDMPPPVFRQLLVGVPVSWLENAVYPVTIDPTISPKTEINDCNISGTHASDWNSARNTSTSYDSSTTEIGSGNTGAAGGDPKLIWRGYATFNTSALPVDHSGYLGVTLTGKLKLKYTTSACASYIVAANWSEPVSSANREANYDLGLSSSKIVEWVDSATATSVGSFYASPDFGNYSSIVPGGTTRMAIVSSNDYDNVDLSGYGIIRYQTWYSGNHATAGDRVYLTIEYQEQPTPLALQMRSGLLNPSIGLYDTRVKLRSKRRDVALSTKVRNEQ